MGEGANRTRALSAEDVASGIGQVELSMVRVGKKTRQASLNPNSMQPPDFIQSRSGGVYLNPVELSASDMKALNECFPPKVSQQAGPELPSTL